MNTFLKYRLEPDAGLFTHIAALLDPHAIGLGIDQNPELALVKVVLVTDPVESTWRTLPTPSTDMSKFDISRCPVLTHTVLP